MHALSPTAKWKFDVFEIFENIPIDINIRDKEDETALSLAIEATSSLALPSTLKRMIDKWNPDLNFVKKDGSTFLHQICKIQHSDPSALDPFIEAGVHPDRQDLEGRTAMMYAAMNDNLEIVQWLIEEANADPNKVCKDGMTALMYAIANPQSPVVMYLLESSKVDLSIKTPVRIAILMCLLYLFT